MGKVTNKVEFQSDARFKKTFKRSRAMDPGNPESLTDYDQTETVYDTSLSRETVYYQDSVGTPGFFGRSKASLPHNEYHLVMMDTGMLSGYLKNEEVVSSTQSLDTTVWAGTGPWTSWETSATAGFLAPDLSAFATLEARADALLLAKVKNQKINVAVALAEGGKTLDMIATNLRRLASLVSALKHGDIWAAGRAIGGRPSRRVRRNFRSQRPQNAAANAWLEMQYGWKPLMSDIKGAISMFGEGDIDSQYIKCQVRVSESFSDVREVTEWRGFIHRADRTSTLAVKKSVLFRADMGLTSLSTRLGLQNPLLLAWELVPYSFVADWALPIGDWLSNLDAVAGVHFIDGSTTFVRESKNKYRVSANPLYAGAWRSTPQYKHQEGQINGESKWVQIDRVKITGFPAPAFPPFKNPISIGHAANALALVQSVFRGRR